MLLGSRLDDFIVTWQNGAFQRGGRVFIRGNHNPAAEGQPKGSRRAA
jgi:hypothetical protein